MWVAKDGKRTYYGEVNGRMVSTRRYDEESALAELVRLNTGAGPTPRLPLDEVWRAEYIEDCRVRGIHPQSVNEKRRHLEEWSGLIGPRAPDLPLLNQVSKDLSGKRGKIATLKAYYTWLREQGRVKRQYDPTLDLRKPSAPTKDWDRLVPIEDTGSWWMPWTRGGATCCSS